MSEGRGLLAPTSLGSSTEGDVDNPELRRELREWLSAHPRPTGSDLAEAGLVAPHLSVPWGRGASPVDQLVIDDELRQAGKIRLVGVTNFDTPQLAALLAAGVSVATHQVQYSVLDQRPAGSMTDLCATHGVQLLCYGALAGGFLAEKYLGQPAPVEPLENRSLVKYRLIIEEFGGWDMFQNMLQVLRRIAAKHQSTISAVAIRHVLDQPQVAGVIVGARNAQHLPATLAAMRLRLDAADRTEIAAGQAAASGPGGDTYTLERMPRGPHAAIMRYNINATS